MLARSRWVRCGVVSALVVGLATGCQLSGAGSLPAPAGGAGGAAPADGWHRQITATVFWIGEDASSDNGGIANHASAWDDEWLRHYGGVDDPDDRRGTEPAAFTPKENPFYIALPYNDFGDDGARRADAATVVPWAATQAWPEDRSMVKNRWVAVRTGDRVVYAQWEDVGPFLEDDAAYVFGSARPRNTVDERAGIDLSPAVRDALGVGGVATVDWRFVDERDVPVGPWRTTVTTSSVHWR